MANEDFVSITFTSILGKLNCLSPSLSECSIFRVNKHLREVYQKAYEPQLVAIGPYHCGKDSLQTMEEHKLRYLQLLLKRRNETDAERDEDLQRFFNALGSIKEEAWKCYAELGSLNENEFIEMMLLDGSFIVEVILKFTMANLREENDPIFGIDFILNALMRDLMLFENQLPFFVLRKLFDMIGAPNQLDMFIRLALRFFRMLFPGPGYRESVDANSHYKHLLQLIHNSWLPSFVDVSNEGEYELYIPSATKLQEAGVKLEKVEGGSLFDVKFEKGIMQIPPLKIEDSTESILRNLVAYEQYFPDTQLSYMTRYVRILDCLIDTPKDVEILCGHGIIDNWLGGDEVVSTIFNKITDSIIDTGSNLYADIFYKVNLHCGKPWNRHMAKLNRDYFNSPWAFISFLAASVLLVLTVVQTVYSIKQ